MSTRTKKPVRNNSYTIAKQHYSGMGIDTDQAIQKLGEISLSLHCWQGDDVTGFENLSTGLGGGIMATGNHPGKAFTPEQLRDDIACALSLIPGRHRVNIHAMYAETDGVFVDRTELEPRHFSGWVDWARAKKIGLDFNPTFFSHPRAASGFTLSSTDTGVRDFWVEHGRASRRIGAHIGKVLGTPCITNFWIPDGYKDICVNRTLHRRLLAESLDRIFSDSIDARHNRDAVESKLFGIGSESFVTGSHEFYLGYALKRGKIPCLDMGHFHPTESITDKISSLMLFSDELLLHVSRGIRWDSDHVVILTDELRSLAEEIIRGKYLKRTHIALDYFDASINRVAAWVIGMRSVQKALLAAMLQPVDELVALEAAGDFTGRLALLEGLKTLPFGAVWDHFCEQSEVLPEGEWIHEIKARERLIVPQRQKTAADTGSRSGERELVSDLCFISHFLASSLDYVQAGGGNTSVKSADGSRMYIKASGTSLADMSATGGWACMDLPRVLSALDTMKAEEIDITEREKTARDTLLASVMRPQGARPSVETYLHALLDTVVMHDHPVAANALTCHPRGLQILRELNADEQLPALWIPFVDPGLCLANEFRALLTRYRRRYKTLPPAVFLENHGFFCTAATVYECVEIHQLWMKRLHDYFDRMTYSKSVSEETQRFSNSIRQAIRSAAGKDVTVRLAAGKELARCAFDNECRGVSNALSPDHIVYIGPQALIVEPGTTPSAIKTKIEEFVAAHKVFPRLIVAQDVAVFVAGESPARLQATEDLAVSAGRIAAMVSGPLHYMRPRDIDFIMNWEVEQYRASLMQQGTKA